MNAEAISAALEGIREQLDAIRAMKAQLTSIGTATKQVYTGLERLREVVLARVCDVETELRLVEAERRG